MRRHPNAGVGRSWLLRTVIRWIEALLRAVCAVQRDCVHGCPTAEGCVLAALCAGSEWQAALCVRQSVQGSWQVCAVQRQGRCGKTEGQLLFLLPG